MHKHVLSYTLSVNIYSIDNLSTKTNTQTYFKERKKARVGKRDFFKFSKKGYFDLKTMLGTQK
jgi:hypothetical protein